ncbi:amino acid permease C-terminal domain-containing protein [Streptantibioticus ferralitis]|uniref:Amino acid permease C-terminal domain-containing protein n=1 Tax=Streptantibioticus ferralitis TaxID=236510 RepID=A0ABT5Z4J4_9ACTN|nr:amino acid permease C-terminal domain-containing protein [Streptantibioticus ferralitis]
MCLVYGLGGTTWLRFAGYLVVGALVYVAYGRRRFRPAGSG